MMIRTAKANLRVLIPTVFLGVVATPLFAQKTYTAASCNLSDVQAAINQELANSVDGDVISIPAGTCTWTGTTAVKASFTHSVTIQGAGAVSATDGGAGTTGSDRTIILDNFSNNGHSILGLSATAGKTVRITGIAFLTNASTAATNNGVIGFGGQSTVRVDHCHFYVYLVSILGFHGGMTGVVDHNYFNSPAGQLTTDIMIKNGMTWNGDTGGQGDRSWADTEHWGGSQFLFIEDNRFYDGSVGDSNSGAARYVFRYNTVLTSTVDYDGGHFFNHGLSPSRGRSTRAAEVYQNVFTRPGPVGGGNVPYSLNGGTLLYWGNRITQYRSGLQIDYTRKDGSTNYNYGLPPSGWGLCNATSAFTNWDGPTSGYPCLDAPGRGAGDLLSGSFPNVVNTRTGTIAHPQQALSPIYIWGNTFTPSGGYSGTAMVSVNASMVAANRDYYQSVGAVAGSTGVVSGVRSARPSSCTAGPGGNTPGVGYWATDESTLYVCTATNTWTAYYTPYTYPHPLTQGTPISKPLPPTNVITAVH